MGKTVERAHAWAIDNGSGWLLPVCYFVSQPALEPNRDGLRHLMFRTRRQARDFIAQRARDTLPRARAVKLTIEVRR